MDNFIYLMVFLLPILAASKLIYDTKGICYFGPTLTTDNEKVVKASHEIGTFDWPSKMHLIEYNRSQLREYWTICLHLLGKIKKDNQSDHMNITLALIANSVSSVLIFFVFKILFGIEIGFIIFLLYVTSFWPYYVATYMGHVHLAQMFFLLSLLLLLLTSYVNETAAFFLFFFGGVFSFVSFFSSSASRKYPPISFVALLFVLRDYFELPWDSDFYVESLSFIIVSSIIFISIIILRRFIVKTVLTMFINKVNMTEEKLNQVESKEQEISLKLMTLNSALYFVLILISTCFNLTNEFIFPLLVYCLGCFIVIAHILLPTKTLPSNIMRYYAWLDVSAWASHFNSYPDKMKTFGFDMPDNFKGAGSGWIHHLFLRFMPVIYPLYILSIILLLVRIYISGYDLFLGHFLFAFIVSIMPVLIHEFTGGLKVGKAYVVAQLFLLVVIAMAFKELIIFIEPVVGAESVYWFTAMIITAQLVHSLYIIYSDTIPCRMAPTYLRNKLKELNVDKFYTYDNSYNDSFVSAMISTYPGEFDVKFINHLSEVSKGVVVIPSVSSKSVSQETQQYAIINGDFDKDQSLNNLLQDKSIEAKAVKKIPTVGASKYYVHESEVTSYRDFVLKQISDNDKWLGNAWILIK